MKNSKTRIFAVTVLAAIFAAAVLALSSCAHVHMYTNVKVIKEATCNEEGQMEASCECGDVIKEEIPAAEHLLGAWEVTRQPACGKTGAKSISCTVCGLVVDTADIPARSHDIITVSAKAASCAQVGHNSYEYCTSCDYTTYSEIPQIPHTPGAEATCTLPRLCTVCGVSVSDPLGHLRVVTEGKPATCTSVGVSDKVECSRCNTLIESAVEIPMRQHVTYVVAGIAPTCSSGGTTDALYCLICNTELAESINLPTGSGEHSFVGKYCEYCDFSMNEYDNCTHQEEKVDDEGDKYFSGTVKNKTGTAATCSSFGFSDWSYCQQCSAIITSPKQLSPASHSLAVLKGVAATPMSVGLSEGYICENANCKLLVNQQEILPIVSAQMLEDGSEQLGGVLRYTVNSDGITCTVTGIGSCTAKEIVIPEYIKGLRVTAIGDEAFMGDTSIVSAELPSSVSKVGKKAFSGCSGLTKIVISDYAEIGDDAFLSCPKLKYEFTHKLVFVPAIEASRCDKPGMKAHYICLSCHERYSDAEAENQLFDVRVTLSHDFGDERCKKCRMTDEEAIIVSISNPKDITVEKGTFKHEIALPATVIGARDITDSPDDSVAYLEVHWDMSGYNGEISGTYEITGYVSFNEYIPRKKGGKDAISNVVTLEIHVK